MIFLSNFREAVGSYAENQRITAVRRVYQRGCVNPMINIEQLWRDYNKYEEVSQARGYYKLAIPVITYCKCRDELLVSGA
jgi:hypothetical protein